MRPFMAVVACLGAIPCSLPASLPAQSSFEGTVTYQFAAGSQQAPRSLTYIIKGPMMRVDMGPQATMLLNESTGAVITLIPQQKIYMEMNAADFMQKGDSAPSPADFTVVKTGKTETIAGTPCEDYQVSNAKRPGHVTEMCVAHGMGNMMAANNSLFGGSGNLPSGYAAVVKKFGGEFFPLRIATTTQGKPQMQMVATDIERKPVDALLFAMPPGYTKMDMGNMGAMLKAQPQP
jgi:hypothetical protein